MKHLAMCGPLRLLQWKNGSSSKCTCNRVAVYLHGTNPCFSIRLVLTPLQVICIWGWQIMWHEWKSWRRDSSFPGTVKRGPELWVPFGKFNEPIWSHSLDLLCVWIGIVLGTIFAGGTLIANKEMSPGELMSFLVASQTVQRWQTATFYLLANIFVTYQLSVLRSLASISILFGQVSNIYLAHYKCTLRFIKNSEIQHVIYYSRLVIFTTDGERN